MQRINSSARTVSGASPVSRRSEWQLSLSFQLLLFIFSVEPEDIYGTGHGWL